MTRTRAPVMCHGDFSPRPMNEVLLRFLQADGSQSASDLLALGKTFDEQAPGQYPQGEPNLCFLTSLAFAVAFPEEWRYCEGLAIEEGSTEPVHHAWLVDHANRVRDDTMPKAIAYFGIVFGDLATWREVAQRDENIARFCFNKAPTMTLVRVTPMEEE
jgi:hypothetical protein